MKMIGLILKGIGGFYSVETEEGRITCKARGRFRKERITPLAGDQVEITAAEDGTGTIDEILPRKNPVSYTHLDVYKRQTQTWFSIKF